MNAYGITVPVATNLTVSLTSSSSSGRFDTSATGPFDGSVTSIIVPAGQTVASVYYEDTTAGTPTLHAAASGVSTTLAMTVIAGAPSTLNFVSAPQNLEAGQPSAPISLVLEDANDNPTPATGTTVVGLTSTSAAGQFTSHGQAATTVSLATGATTATFVYIDTTAGSPTITASATGLASGTQTELVTWGAVTQLTLTGTPSVIAGAPSGALQVTPLNAYGITVPVATNLTVSLTSSSSSGRFDTSATGPFDGSVTSIIVPAGQTVASVYYEDTTAGTPTLHAAASGVSTTLAMTVIAGAPSTLKFVSAPQNLEAGQPSAPISLVLEDANDNPTPATGTTVVGLTSTSAAGQFTSHGQAATTVSLATGATTATFVYIDTTAGSPTITASATGLASGTQTEVISAGPPAGFTLSATNNTLTAGQPSAMTVTTVNAYGEVVPATASMVVSLQTTSATGGFDTSVGGSFAVANVTIASGATSVGFYYRDTATASVTVTASLGGLTSGTYVLNINAAAPYQLKFLSVPLDATVGSASAPVTVGVEDEFGNPATVGDTASVSFASSATTTEFSLVPGGPWTAALNAPVAIGGQTATVYLLDTIAGSETLTATSAGLLPATQTATIGAGALARLQFTSAPQTVAVHTPAAITITGYDAFNNPRSIAHLVNGNAVPLVVQLGTGSTSGTFSAAATPWTPISQLDIPYGANTATFQYQDATPLTTVLTVQDVGGLYPPISQSITVTAGPPTQMSFSSAAQTVVVDTPSQPLQLELLDQYGNLASVGGNVTVQLLSSSPTAEFSADGVSGWAAGINATYAAPSTSQTVYYRDATTGVATITASATGLSSASQLISVIPGTISQVVMTASPGADAGQSTAVQVETETADGLSAGVSTATAVQLTGAAGGQYSLSATAWAPVSTVTIPARQSQLQVFYKEDQSGTDVLGAQAPISDGWTAGTATVVIGAGSITTYAFVTPPLVIAAGTPSAGVVVEAQDQYGNPAVSGFDQTIYLYGAASSQFSLGPSGPWSATSVTLGAGTSDATFYYNDAIPGTKTITAADHTPLDSPDSGIASATATVVVTSLPATQLEITSAPQSMVAGALSGPVVIVARQADGQAAVPGSPLVVNLSSTSPAGTFRLTGDGGAPPATQVSIPIGASQVTVWYSSAASGTFDLTAAGSGLSSATQSIQISSGPATQLAFLTNPQTANAGIQSTQMRVELRDALGNPATESTDTVVNLASTSSVGTFSAVNGAGWTPLSSITLSAGSSDVYLYYLDTASGVDTLTASAPGENSITSATQAFTVDAATASGLEVTSASQSIIAGQTSGAVLISLVDAFGNAVPNPTSMTVYLWSTSAGGAFAAASTFATPVTQVTMIAGSGVATAYYRDSDPGTATMTFADLPPRIRRISGWLTPSNRSMSVRGLPPNLG